MAHLITTVGGEVIAVIELLPKKGTIRPDASGWTFASINQKLFSKKIRIWYNYLILALLWVRDQLVISRYGGHKRWRPRVGQNPSWSCCLRGEQRKRYLRCVRAPIIVVQAQPTVGRMFLIPAVHWTITLPRFLLRELGPGIDKRINSAASPIFSFSRCLSKGDRLWAASSSENLQTYL